MHRLVIAFALLLGIVGSARADDIAATQRSVVRVVTIAMVDGHVAGFGHGSGFAIAPDRIVTNAHVVELAQRYPDNVVIGVVPSEGSKSYRGHLVAYDPKRDLALIAVDGAALPPATLYTGPAQEGDAVVALGYPGNVDVATAQSAADYIHPLSPVRSDGVFSGRRSLTGIDVLLHTASIARGNSGGPLLDRCGRVIGVNSAITHGEEGDSSFGFAIADSELAAFLRDAGQPYQSVGTPCTSIEDRLRQDSDADARALADAAAERREAATTAAVRHEAALEKARAEAEHGRENIMALAGVLLVAGALALGGAGLLASRRRTGPAIWAAAGGTATVIASALVFVFRPSAEVTLPPEPAPSATPLAPGQPLGALDCALLPERSRIVVSSTGNVPLDWGRQGCADGKVQWREANRRWERIVVPATDQTVSVLGFDPVTRTYSDTRYFLSAEAMAAVRKLAAPAAPGCTIDPTRLVALAARDAAIKAALPPLPNEKLVYSCAARR